MLQPLSGEKRYPEGSSRDGDAVRVAVESMSTRTGTVLVLFGGDPLIRRQIQPAFLARQAGASIVVLGFRAGDPAGYGRLILDEEGALEARVEDKDANESRALIFAMPVSWQLTRRYRGPHGAYQKRQCQGRVLPDGYRRLGAERWAELQRCYSR